MMASVLCMLGQLSRVEEDNKLRRESYEICDGVLSDGIRTDPVVQVFDQC